MTLQASGAISLDDIHVEAGGTTGTLASINDTDIRNLISSTPGTTVSFDDFYGAGGVVVEVGDGTVSDVVTSPASAVASITFNNNGTIAISGNSSSYSDTAWASPTGTGTGDAYEIQVTATGSGGTFTGTTGSWVALTTNKQWTLSQSGAGGASRDLTVSIRDTATSTVQDTAAITLSVLVIA